MRADGGLAEVFRLGRLPERAANWNLLSLRRFVCQPSLYF